MKKNPVTENTGRLPVAPLEAEKDQVTALKDTKAVEVEAEREYITIPGKGRTQEIECLPVGIVLAAAHKIHSALVILRHPLTEKLSVFN